MHSEYGTLEYFKESERSRAENIKAEPVQAQEPSGPQFPGFHEKGRARDRDQREIDLAYGHK